MSTPDPKDLKAVSWAKHIKQLPFGQTDSTVDLNWAELSLTYDAVMGNSGPVMSGRKEGIADFTETCSRVQELVEKYGGRAIELRKDGASWALDGGYVQVSAWRDIAIRFASIDKNFSEEVNKIMDSLGTVPPTGTVYVLTASDSGLSFTPMGLSGQKIIAENYSPEVIEGYKKIVRDLGSANPTGRLSIINGPAGTGKTFLIKGLLSQTQNAIFCVIPAAMIQQLTNPEVIPTMIGLRRDKGAKMPLVFIIEDADETLVNRENGNMSAISTVLNLCDGILGSLLDIRIVATTNATFMDIDKALMRPGRLSAHMEVVGLSPEQSQAVLDRLCPGQKLPEPSKSYTLAEVYLLSKEKTEVVTGVKPKKTAVIGFGK